MIQKFELDVDVLALRNKLFECIRWLLKRDGHCKSYEGAWRLEVVLPGYFNSTDDIVYRISLDCYLIGPSRHYHWDGATWEEAFQRCRADVNKWIDEAYSPPDSSSNE